MRRLILVLIILFSGHATTTAQGRPPISPENAAQVVPVELLGRGYWNDLDWSPDGKVLAVASSVGLWLFDTADWQAEPRRFEGAFVSLAYSPDGSVLAAAEQDGMLWLWDTATWAGPRRLKMDSAPWVTDISFHPDGVRLAAAHFSGLIELWDTATGEPDRSWKVNHFTTSIAFSPDGAVIASGNGAMKSDQGWVYFWDVETGDPLGEFNGSFGPVEAIVYSPDGTRLAISGYDPDIRLCDTQTYELAEMLETNSQYVHQLAFSADGQQLASASEDESIRVWDVAAGEARTIQATATLLHFSPDGTWLAAADPAAGTLGVWNVSSGQPEVTLPGYSLKAFTLAFSPDGMTIAAGASSNDNITLWTPGQAPEIWQQEGLIQQVVFSGDGSTLFSTSVDYHEQPTQNYLWGWDRTTGDHWELDLGRPFIVSQMQPAPDGHTVGLLVRSEGRCGLVLTDTLTWHDVDCNVRLFLFSPQGVLLVENKADKTVRLSSLETGETLYHWSGSTTWVTAAAISLDGLSLAMGNQAGQVWLIDLTTGDHHVVENGPAVITALAFSPDARLLAVSSFLPVVRLWDVQQGKVAAELLHYDNVRDLAFSPDGTLLATASQDYTVRLWGVP